MSLRNKFLKIDEEARWNDVFERNKRAYESISTSKDAQVINIFNAGKQAIDVGTPVDEVIFELNSVSDELFVHRTDLWHIQQAWVYYDEYVKRYAGYDGRDILKKIVNIVRGV